MSSPTERPSRLVARGLCRRCPVCGERGIFESWFVQRDRCPTCNFPTTRVPDQWIGAFGMNLIVTFTLLAISIAAGFVLTYPQSPIGALMAVCMSIALVFPLLFQPISRSLWSAIDVAMRAPEPSDDVRLPQPAPLNSTEGMMATMVDSLEREGDRTASAGLR